MHDKHFIQLGKGQFIASWLAFDLIQMQRQAKEEDTKSFNPAAKQKVFHRQGNERIEIEIVAAKANSADGNDWQKHEAKKKQRKVFQRNTRLTEETSEEYTMKIVNIWELPLQLRWRLYRHWIGEYRRDLRKTMSDNAIQYQMAADRLKEVHGQIDLLIMRHHIIGTLIDFGQNRHLQLF